MLLGPFSVLSPSIAGMARVEPNEGACESLLLQSSRPHLPLPSAAAHPPVTSEGGRTKPTIVEKVANMVALHQGLAVQMIRSAQGAIVAFKFYNDGHLTLFGSKTILFSLEGHHTSIQ